MPARPAERRRVDIALVKLFVQRLWMQRLWLQRRAQKVDQHVAGTQVNLSPRVRCAHARAGGSVTSPLRDKRPRAFLS
jgi:hypothetical protein